MNTRKLTSLVALATVPFLLSACVVNMEWQTGNGVAVTETRHLPAFSRVELDAPVRVTVMTGNVYQAIVTGDANLVSYFETDAFGGTLTISQDYAVDPVVEPHITLVVPDLASLVHNGMGVVEIPEDDVFPALSLTLNGGGEIRFSGTAGTLKAVNNGYGRIYAEGYAGFLHAVMRGNGEISAEYLRAADADVDLSGSGDVYLNLDYGSELNVSLSGSGKVEWWGAPARLKYDLTGSGEILEHRGLPKKTVGVAEKPQAGALAKPAAAGQPYETVQKGAGLRK